MRSFIYTLTFVAAFTVGLTATINSSSGSEVAADIVLTDLNTVTLDTDVNSDSIRDLQLELQELVNRRGSRNYPIYIAVKSPGGSVTAGEMLVEWLKGYKNIHFIMIYAYSMGAVMPQLHTGTRYVLENSDVMLHKMAIILRQSFKSAELERIVERLQKLEDRLETKIANRMGISLPEYRKLTAEDWFMDAQEAIEKKVADQIVVVRCDKSLAKTEDVTIESPIPGFIPDIKVKKSKCPLIL